jgi:hypothetical protein
VDAVTLEQALSAGSPADLELAERLYRGEFLAGLAIEEAPFEDWRATEAERLRRRLLRGLQTLLARHVEGATWRQVSIWASAWCGWSRSPRRPIRP